MKTLSILPQKVTSFFLGILIFTTIISCEGKREAGSQDSVSNESVAVTALNEAPPIDETDKANDQQKPATPSPQSKIIRNASLRFQVKDYRKNIRSIETIIKRYEGFIVNSNETRIDNSLQNSLSIRVPAKNLDNLINELAKQALYLDYKNISSEDVSTEFVDVSARLKAKQAVEQRYLDLLKQAKTIKDILEIETELRQIREEIESGQARINYITSQVAYSTVSLEIYENRTAISDNNSFWVRIINAVKNGWEILLSIIVGLLNLWPFLLLIPVLIFGFRKFIRRYPPVK